MVNTVRGVSGNDGRGGVFIIFIEFAVYWWSVFIYLCKYGAVYVNDRGRDGSIWGFRSSWGFWVNKVKEVGV